MKLTYWLFLGILFFLSISLVAAQEDAPARPETIVVKEGQNVRELAKIHLNDPNLWTEILRVNDLDSPADVKPNMTLKLPDPIINKADAELEKAKKAIDEASKAGAKLFAPGVIARAIRLQNDALAKRKARDWSDCYQFAHEAVNMAKSAVEKSLVHSEAAGQAILTDRKGTVQSRHPSDQLWKDLTLKSVLVEGEKVRTLSNSYAEIEFKDSKRVRLNENSQIVISKMHAEVVKDKEETSVSLMKGDAYMLLGGKPKRVDSDVKKQKKPKAYGKQLPPPQPVSPENGITLLFGPRRSDIGLKWEKVPDASSYWLEIASDRGFKRMVLNQKNLDGTAFTQSQLKDGVYYWRVAAVDANGYPGTNSKVRFFKTTSDNEPPYLAIYTPRNGEILATNPVQIRGKTEPDAILSSDDHSVEISGDGTYRFEHPLSKGVNKILLKATDRAGNVTNISRSFFFDPKTDAAITYHSDLPRIRPKHFITRDTAFTLTGRTEPNTAVAVHAKKKSGSRNRFPSCVADDEGRFRLSLPLESAKTTFLLSVKSPGGHVTRDTFVVEMDNQPPEIRLSGEPSPVSAVQEIQLIGTVSEKSSLSLNGKPVPSDENQFHAAHELQPGMNAIRLVARDRIGNISFLDRKVMFDPQPPKFIDFTLSHEVAAGGESLDIRVQAEDEHGLKEAAEFKLHAGEYVHTGFLKLNNATQTYQGRVNLPEQAKGKIRLDHVRLSDYNDNERQYDMK